MSAAHLTCACCGHRDETVIVKPGAVYPTHPSAVHCVERLKEQLETINAALTTPEGYVGIVADAVADELERTKHELATLKASLADPAAVWTNMLRGTIARPGALDHYEQCKARVEELERQRAEDTARVDWMEKQAGVAVGHRGHGEYDHYLGHWSQPTTLREQIDNAMKGTT